MRFHLVFEHLHVHVCREACLPCQLLPHGTPFIGRNMSSIDSHLSHRHKCMAAATAVRHRHAMLATCMRAIASLFIILTARTNTSARHIVTGSGREYARHKTSRAAVHAGRDVGRPTASPWPTVRHLVKCTRMRVKRCASCQHHLPTDDTRARGVARTTRMEQHGGMRVAECRPAHAVCTICTQAAHITSVCATRACTGLPHTHPHLPSPQPAPCEREAWMG